MRTLVLSDLHLGCGGSPGIFAGARALVEMIEELATEPLRIVLNGDTFDFPAQDATSEVAYALTRDPDNARVLSALGRAIHRGGELIVRSGLHDPEIALTAVQDHVVRGLQVPAEVARRVSFHAAMQPTRCLVGGVLVLVSHALREVSPVAGGPAYDLINPLRRQFGVGLPDLLRPHPEAAGLAGLVVNPTAVKHVLRELPDAGRRILQALRGSPAFARAQLSPREREVMLAALDPAVRLGAAAFSDGSLRSARLKLLRVGLRDVVTASASPRAVSDAEWASARALARDAGAAAVIAGHTHAAGWRAEEGLVACDTGAWTWLARVPVADSDDEVWEAYLDQWQQTPRIDARPGATPPPHTQPTAALLVVRGRGAALMLIERRAGASVCLREQAMSGL